MSFSLDPYQDQQNQHSVGPDLGPNFFKGFQQSLLARKVLELQ